MSTLGRDLGGAQGPGVVPFSGPPNNSGGYRTPVLRSSSPEVGLWLRNFAPRPAARSRVVCFPHAGGSASFFAPLSRALVPEVELWAVQYPGRQDRRGEPFITTIQALAARIAATLDTTDGKPVVFFGHSMGALVAFETARLVERAHKSDLRAVVVSGRRAPRDRREEDVHLRGDDGLLAEVARLSGTDARLLDDLDVREMVLPPLRNDYRAVETYRYQGGHRLACPLWAVTGDADPRVTPAEVEGWQEYTSGGFRLGVLPGGHFYLSEQTPKLAAFLQDCMRSFAA